MNNAEKPQLTIPRVIGCLSFFNADNLEIMRGFADNEFDLAIVDPPYGLERFKRANEETTGVYAKRGSWKHDGEKNWNNEKPTEEYWNELFRISKNQIVWGANNFQLPPSEYFCIWDKVQYMPNFASAEYAWVSMGLKKPAKVFRYEIHKENALRKADGGKLHPTQKPIQLYDFILKNYANQNAKILDTHLGSGSIAIAVEKANRLDKMNLQFVGIEIDKEYFEKALNRIEQYCRQGTLSF
jgi:site-specific DNA-methyltransferase (adenine-specific)